MKTDAAFLRAVEGLKDLTDSLLYALAAEAEEEPVPLGGLVAHADKSPDELFAVQSGLIGLFHEERGGALTPFQAVGPRELFGLGSFLYDEDGEQGAPLCARALIPGVVVRLPSAETLPEGFGGATAYRRLWDTVASRIEVGLLLAETSNGPLIAETACPIRFQSRLSVVLSPATRQVLGTCPLVGMCAPGRDQGCRLAALRAGRPPLLWPIS